MLSSRIERVIEAAHSAASAGSSPAEVGEFDAHHQALQGVRGLPHDPVGIGSAGPAEHGVGPDVDTVLAGNLPHPVTAEAEPLADLTG